MLFNVDHPGCFRNVCLSGLAENLRVQELIGCDWSTNLYLVIIHFGVNFTEVVIKLFIAASDQSTANANNQ